MRDVFGIAHAVWVSSSFGSIDRGDKDDILYNHGCYFIISSIAFYLIKSQLVLLHPILSYPVLPILPYPILLYLILSILSLFYPVQFSSILSFSILSYPSHPILSQFPYIHLYASLYSRLLSPFQTAHYCYCFHYDKRLITVLFHQIFHLMQRRKRLSAFQIFAFSFYLFLFASYWSFIHTVIPSLIAPAHNHLLSTFEHSLLFHAYRLSFLFCCFVVLFFVLDFQISIQFRDGYYFRSIISDINLIYFWYFIQLLYIRMFSLSRLPYFSIILLFIHSSN